MENQETGVLSRLKLPVSLPVIRAYATVSFFIVDFLRKLINVQVLMIYVLTILTATLCSCICLVI